MTMMSKLIVFLTLAMLFVPEVQGMQSDEVQTESVVITRARERSYKYVKIPDGTSVEVKYTTKKDRIGKYYPATIKKHGFRGKDYSVAFNDTPNKKYPVN